MRSKGFTLIELLVVIAILGLLMTIVIPNVIGIFNDSKKTLNDNQIDTVEEAARMWGVSNISISSGAPSKSFVTIGTLRNEGYLEDKDVKSLIDKKVVNKNTKVCISYSSNQLVYKFNGAC